MGGRVGLWIANVILIWLSSWFMDIGNQNKTSKMHIAHTQSTRLMEAFKKL